MVIKRPPMGWNSWNTFGNNISDSLIRETADAFIDLGLKDAGYEYVVIDDCWAERKRDEITGKMVPDHEKFPNGMKALSDYVHAKGLKFGMYSDAGERTCANYPGSMNFEFLDAETFAEWGVDYLKYDFCYVPSYKHPATLYKRMGLALKSCGRDILYAACDGLDETVSTWMRASGAQIYRTTRDIFDSFESFKGIAQGQLKNMKYSFPGCYNDLDMLTVGMYGKGNVGGGTGCTDTEYRMQFALWCMMSSPLMLGCDVRKMNDVTRDLVTNKTLLRINQDLEARPPMDIPDVWDWNNYGGRMTLFKHLTNNEMALAFFNFEDRDASYACYVDELGLPNNVGYHLEFEDAFTGERFRDENGLIAGDYGPHDCRVFLGRIVKD